MNGMPKSARISLFILMFNLFIALLGQGMVIPILPEYLKQFHAAGTAAGYLIAAFGAARLSSRRSAASCRTVWGASRCWLPVFFNCNLGSVVCCRAHAAPLICGQIHRRYRRRSDGSV